MATFKAHESISSRWWTRKVPFYADKIFCVCVTADTPGVQTQAQGDKGTAKDPQSSDSQGAGLKCPHMTIDQVLAAENLSEYENDLRDRYFEVVYHEGKPDEQLANELFQAFGALIAVRFGNVVFTRRGL